MRFAVLLSFAPLFAQPVTAPPAMERVTKANYELASRWSAQKVGKIVFDLGVEPRWFETSDKFWYAFETTQGKRWLAVDPTRKTKAPLFDNSKLAAQLTAILRIPYDSLHLPMQNARLVNQDAALFFEVTVPVDAEIPGLKKPEAPKDVPKDALKTPPAKTRTVYLQYELASARLALLPDHKPLKKTRWASMSPDEKTVVFARGHNLYTMDAANYLKATEKEDDASIVETHITTDGEENFGYARRLNEEEKKQYKFTDKNKTPRVPAVTAFWAKDSRKFSVIRADNRKVSDLWVINSLANPRPVLESYRYAMPGETNVTLNILEVFDLASKARVTIEADLFKDQSLGIYSSPVSNKDRENARKYTL